MTVLVVGPWVDVVARLAEGRAELLAVGQVAHLYWDYRLVVQDSLVEVAVPILQEVLAGHQEVGQVVLLVADQVALLVVGLVLLHLGAVLLKHCSLVVVVHSDEAVVHSDEAVAHSGVEEQLRLQLAAGRWVEEGCRRLVQLVVAR